MKKNQLLSLKPVVLKQKITQKSPIQSHRTANTLHDTSLDNLCKTERDVSNPKYPGVSIVSPKGLPSEEDKTEVLIKATDRAIEAINNGNNQFALVTLQGVENDLEQEAAEGKILDRNLIITCLYNLACVYQAMWALDDCLKYIDAVIYNLDESLIDEHPKSPKKAKASPTGTITLEDPANIASKLRKKNLLLKVYLQQSAILSHLERHTEAYSKTKSAHNLMESIIQDLLSASTSIKASDSSHNKSFNKELINYSYASQISGLTSSRAREAYSFFKDEISYTKSLIEYADGFLKEFTKMLKTFAEAPMPDILKRAKNSLNNWKNNIEGKQKAARKGLSKKGPLFSGEGKMDSRSLLGVQHKPDWQETFNIDSIIQMSPIRYREYAHKKDIANYLSQDSLQEKAIYQSVIFFMIGTETRFLESVEVEDKNAQAELKKSFSEISSAETYYLKAIDTVCRYITGPCAYIDHLTARYLKHYARDLDKKPTDVSIDQEPVSKTEPDQIVEQKKVTRSPKLYLTLSSKPSDFPGKIIVNDDSPRHANEQKRIECAPSTNTSSLLDKVSQKIVVEGKESKKTLTLRLRKLENDLTKASVGKVPVIKLSPKLGDIDLEDSLVPSADRSLISRNKNHSPKANPASPLSQASTSMSPIRLKTEDRKTEEEYHTQPATSFDLIKNMPVPNLKLNRIDREIKEKQYASSFLGKVPSARENGYTSQRSRPDTGTSRNKSSELQKWITKIHGLKPEKTSLRTDTTRFDMYKELKKVTNPQTNRETNTKLKKRETTMSGIEKENSKSSRMVTSFSREHALPSKKESTGQIKNRCFPTPSKYIKTREKTTSSHGKTRGHISNLIQENRNNKSELTYRKQGQLFEDQGTLSPESVEEFNNSNM